MFRDTPQAFASDAKALELAKMSIRKNHHSAVGANAMWFYLPFMHSENLADQEKCCELFEGTSIVCMPVLRTRKY